jgi:hypothetical protein
MTTAAQRRSALAAAAGAALTAAAALAGGLPGARTIALAIVPNVAWCGFFLAAWRRPERLPRAAASVLIFAIPARVLYLAAYLYSAPGLSLAAWVITAAECAAAVGWAMLLTAFAAHLEKPPKESVAAVVAVVLAIAAIDDVFLAASRILAIADTPWTFWRSNPFGAFLRRVAEPAIQVYFLAAQVMFLRALAASRDADSRPAWGAL